MEKHCFETANKANVVQLLEIVSVAVAFGKM